jgi:hypothetical protein
MCLMRVTNRIVVLEKCESLIGFFSIHTFMGVAVEGGCDDSQG